MRLTSRQIAVIRKTAADTFGPQARVWLFGSRTDDQARGRDIACKYAHRSDRSKIPCVSLWRQPVEGDAVREPVVALRDD